MLLDASCFSSTVIKEHLLPLYTAFNTITSTHRHFTQHSKTYLTLLCTAPHTRFLHSFWHSLPFLQLARRRAVGSCDDGGRVVTDGWRWTVWSRTTDRRTLDNRKNFLYLILIRFLDIFFHWRSRITHFLTVRWFGLYSTVSWSTSPFPEYFSITSLNISSNTLYTFTQILIRSFI